MGDNNDYDICMNDANSSSFFNASPVDAPLEPACEKEKSEETTASICHELLSLHDLEQHKNDHDIKTLSLTGRNENWLYIRAEPATQFQDCVEKTKSSEDDDEKKEENQTSFQERYIQKTDHIKTASELFLHTQEPSQSQQAATEMPLQTQMQTQESQTQESMSMSLLAYLNQKSQESNKDMSVSTDIRPHIEILSGDALWSVSSPGYPPTDFAFLCFEEISFRGKIDGYFMAVKDMRPPLNPTISSDVIKKGEGVVTEVDLLPASQDSLIDWKPLPRRQLIVLYPGDRIRITLKTQKSASSDFSADPNSGLFADVVFILEYRRTEIPTKKQPDSSFLAHMTETKSHTANDIKSDTIIDNGIESNDIENNGITLKESTSDDGVNTFYGTRKGEAKNKQQNRDLMPPPEKCSTPKKLNKDLHRTFTPGDSSVAVDSTVNTQQESLRSSRLKLFDCNLDGGGNVENQEIVLQSEKQNSPCDTNDESSKIGSKDNSNNNVEKKEENDESKAVDDSYSSMDHNYQEPKDNNTQRNAEDTDQGHNSSVANVRNPFTQETCDPSLDQSSNDEHESDNSSDVTIPLYYTQDADHTAVDKTKDTEDKKLDEQSKLNSNQDAFKADTVVNLLCKGSTAGKSGIPQNIEIESDDQADGNKPPVSQLLLSMETDNEDDNNDMDDAKQVSVSKIEKEAREKFSNNKDIRQNDSSSQHEATITKDPITSVQQESKKSIDNDSDPVNDNVFDGNKGLNNGVDTSSVHSTEAQFDDETIVGTGVVMQNAETPSKTTRSENQCEHPESLDSSSLVAEKTHHEGSDEANQVGSAAIQDQNETESQSKKFMNDVANGEVEEITPNDKLAKEGQENTSPSINECGREITTPNDEKADVSTTISTRRLNDESTSISGAKRKSLTLNPSTNDVDGKESEVSDPVNALDNVDVNTERRRSNRRSSNKVKSPTYSKRDLPSDAPTFQTRPNKRRRNNSSRNDSSETDLTAARTAGKFYGKRFSAAIKKGVVNVVVSGFEQNEMARITRLCKTKFSNETQLKIVDTINDDTTACILPTVSNDSEEASCRTLKAIQCALLGIPMISISWLDRCKREQKVIVPTSYIWTLSSKVGRLSMRDQAKYGIARLAIARSKGSQMPTLLFKNSFAFLWGVEPMDKKKTMMNLLKEGCASVLSSSREASAKLKAVTESKQKSTSPPKTFVLVLGDRAISKTLHAELKAALEVSTSRKIYIVDSNWVSLSIACARMLPPDDFRPKVGVDLWQLSKELP